MFRASVATGSESFIDPVGITTYTLPSALNGTYSWISKDSMWVDGGELVTVWVDENRHVRLSRKLYNRPYESSIDLAVQTGTVFGAQVTLDSHNVIAVAKDSLGLYHVSGDMHAVPLKYMRSAAPGSTTSWVSGMVGTEETNATYPQFVKAKSGNLYFWYRTGFSGDGDWILNKWSITTQTWTRVATVLQGTVENVSAYPQNIAVDQSTGRWHMLWTIRKDFSSDAENENIYYAYSDNEGVTWRKTDGTAYTLPITWASGEVIVPLAGGSTETISNGGSTSINTSGRPESVWLVGDSGGIDRYRHVWLDGSGIWHYDTLMPTTNSSGRVPSILCWPDGRRWMFFQNGAGGRGNTLRYYDLDAQTETVILNKNMIHYLPAVYYSVQRNEAFVLGPYERQDGAQGGDPADLGAQLNVPVLVLR